MRRSRSLARPRLPVITRERRRRTNFEKFAGLIEASLESIIVESNLKSSRVSPSCF